MMKENFGQSQQVNKVFKYSQVQEIIQAIILGKYSWACVLFLRFSGCNPLEYMAYEDYTKLVEENHATNEDNQNYDHEKPVKNTVS